MGFNLAFIGLMVKPVSQNAINTYRHLCTNGTTVHGTGHSKIFFLSMLVSASCLHKEIIKIENKCKIKYKHFTKNGESNDVLHMK